MDSAGRSVLSVNERAKGDPAGAAPVHDPLDGVMRYHQETKHHFSRFARAPGFLDWTNQPDPFRRYEGSPSSGNLHPTEAYLLIDDVAGLSPSPGLYHYAAKEHALELRAQWPKESFMRLLQGFPPNAFLIGFASVIWRETWKYGERAFRYCQHDVGHAIGSMRIAAQTLGWCMLLLDGTADDTLAALLGVDRDEDFEGAEQEHPDCIAVIWPADRAASPATVTTSCVPLSLAADAVCDAMQLVWRGKASRLSRDEPVQWEILDQMVLASWKSSTEQKVIEMNHGRSCAPSHHATPGYPGPPSAAQVIRQRRSALAFDGTTSISAGSLFTMLARVMPGVERHLCRRPMPWDVLPWEPAIHLALFVHRVDGLNPGLYLLVRQPAKVERLRGATHPHFDWTSPAGCPEDLPLFLLQEGDARALAAELSCGQDIAGESSFSLGMIAEFESSLRQYGPWFYRRLFWEAGLVGQVLYLEAEAAGVRATGIGCFFDDPVHQVMGFNDASFQSLYHFTTGGPVEDPRLTTLPPYGLGH